MLKENNSLIDGHIAMLEIDFPCSEPLVFLYCIFYLTTFKGTFTSGKKFISILRKPAPLQVSQRPPETLNENLPAL